MEAEELLSAAREARGRAYAPYSGFAVGAALLDDQGALHLGANVENASYGLCTCAERSAVARAVSDGRAHFRAIAVAGPAGQACMPCGSCRQILFEFAPEITVVVDNESGVPRQVQLRELLPEAFGPSDLTAAPRR